MEIEEVLGDFEGMCLCGEGCIYTFASKPYSLAGEGSSRRILIIVGSSLVEHMRIGASTQFISFTKTCGMTAGDQIQEIEKLVPNHLQKGITNLFNQKLESLRHRVFNASFQTMWSRNLLRF